jgi:hypothetical protein
MSKELAVVSNDQLQEFLKASGQADTQGQNFTTLPRITTNKVGEDDDGNAIPVGTFKVSQDGKSVYGKTATFRVIKNAYQYSVYDDTENKYTNRSVIFQSWNEEAIDEKGGVACGKIRAKQMPKEPSKQLLAEQSKIKCYRLVYGVLTMDGVDSKGEKVEIKELPAYFRLSGSNFMPIQQNGLDPITKKNYLWPNVPLNLSLKRDKQGQNVWYTINVNPDFDNSVKLSAQDIENSKLFTEVVDKENAQIAEKYKSAKKADIDTSDDADVIDSLDNDFNDDISDVGN